MKIQKKKMLYVITKSNWGGAQRYVYDLATALPKDQFEVSVAFGQEGLLAKKLREARIALPYQSSSARHLDSKRCEELF